jgi:hypothetical protein
MPAWSNRLPDRKKHMGFDIKRCPQSSPLHAIITCDEFVVCDTHFWGGRTIPCERKSVKADGSVEAGNCAACNESVPYRTHVYVSALDPKTQDHFIFECTAHAAKPLEEYREATGTLRGCIMHATRPKQTPNGKVVIQTNTANLARSPLPSAPNLILALTTIWRLPLTGMAITDDRCGKKKSTPRREPIDRMRKQPDNAEEPKSMADILGGNGRSKS